MIILPSDLPYLTIEPILRLYYYSKIVNAKIASPFWGTGYPEVLITYIDARKKDFIDFETIEMFKKYRKGVSRGSDLLRSGKNVFLVGVNYLSRNPMKEFSHMIEKGVISSKGFTGLTNIYYNPPGYNWRGDLKKLLNLEYRFYSRLGIRLILQHVVKDIEKHD